MSVISVQLNTDSALNSQANALFNALGMDMSTAFNLFLKQCVLHDGLPFNVELPTYKQEVLDAMDEALQISRDPNVKGYTDVEEFFKELDG